MGPELIRIEASAGAGKTYMLAIRYLRLLRRVGPPGGDALRRIVAITFTNKAASEMKDRILRFLKEIAFETPRGRKLSSEVGLGPREAAEWIEAIISNFSDFHVRTIDSLLFAILKGLSFEMGLRPDMEVVFSQDAVLERAFDMLISNLSGEDRGVLEEALETFLEIDERPGFYPEPGLRKRILDIFKETGGNVKRKRVDRSFVNDRSSQIMDFFKGEFLRVFKSVKDHLNRSKIRDPFSVGSVFDLLGKPFIKRDPDDLFKKSSKASEDVRASFRKVHNELRRMLEEFSDELSELSFEKVGGYVPFLGELERRVSKVCMEEGVILGGRDWSQKACEAIGGDGGAVPLVYAHFGSEFYHFLFDEFQDTSRDQWYALLPIVEDVLSRGGSLFLVGDVKQAIYGWRGGDWTLFDEVVSSFVSVGSPETLRLDKNYRSCKTLVEFFNRLFQPLSDKGEVKDILGNFFLKGAPSDVLDDVSSSVSSAFSSHYQVPVRGDIPRSGFFIYKCGGKRSKDDLREVVRSKFLEDVRLEWEMRETVESGAPIAVLVRTNDDVEEVSSWLIQSGIPVVTENALKLSSSLAVKGIVSFLSYLYDPGDEVSLYGFLASGLLEGGPASEEELSSLWLQGDCDPWKKKVEDLRRKLSPLLNRRSPYELMFSLLEEIGITLERGGRMFHQAPFIRRLLELSHRFELENGPSISKFLSFCEEGGLEERVGLPESVDAVRVLTIHRAKGLEFPVVFIPFTDWSVRNTSPVVKTDDGYLAHLTPKYCI